MKKFLLILIALLLVPSIATAQVNKYYANALDGNELGFYDAVRGGIVNRDDTVYVSDFEINKDDVNGLVYCVYDDSPELFYQHPYWKWIYVDGGTITRVELTYDYTIEETEQLNTQLNQKSNEILSELSIGTTDYEKAKYIYAYLAKNIEYSREIDDGQTIVGGLLYGKAVCVGISKSFQYLANKIGMNCITASTGEHSWNIVQVDGDWYHLDLTPKIQYEGDNTIEPFLYSDNYFSVYKEDCVEPIPACTSDKYLMVSESSAEPTMEPTETPMVEPTVLPTDEEQKTEPLLWYVIGVIGVLTVLAWLVIRFKKR